jgi:hypothetical protein
VSHQRGIARCPHCDRTVTTDCGRFNRHSLTPHSEVLCPLSDQKTPIAGDTPTDYVSRAYLIADLADQVQDRDPQIVWAYLSALPVDEVRRLLQLALAAIPIEGRKVQDIWAWVDALPAARVASGTASLTVRTS